MNNQQLFKETERQKSLVTISQAIKIALLYACIVYGISIVGLLIIFIFRNPLFVFSTTGLQALVFPILFIITQIIVMLLLSCLGVIFLNTKRPKLILIIIPILSIVLLLLTSYLLVQLFPCSGSECAWGLLAIGLFYIAPALPLNLLTSILISVNLYRKDKRGRSFEAEGGV
ncbi:hypothetical protein KJ840_05825 [Patescibacteria group bacterium]|nr:hypothetical protein [Patescibacteria group bacterium]